MSSSRSFLRSHQTENCATATKYALRVFLLRMLAVKNSQKRRPEFPERKKIAGRLPGEAPTAASWRPETGARPSKLWSGGVIDSIYDNVLYLTLSIPGTP